MDIKTLLRTKRKLNGFDKIMLVLNGVLALMLLLCYLAPITNPCSFWPIAILGLGYQVFLPANLVFLLYWLIRSRPYMLISGVCLLLGLGVFFKYWEFHFSNQPDKKASADDIRMMSYNVHDFMNPFVDRGTQKEISNLIADKQPDIITIQEYTNNILDWKSTNKALVTAMQSNNHYFKAYDYTSWDSTGIAIYTRYPIINHGLVAPLPGDKSKLQAIFIDVKYKNKIIRIYTAHLKPIDFEAPEHEYLHNLPHTGRLSIHESMLIVNKLKIAFIKRSYQVSAIKKHIAKCPYPYLIAGDFNDTPASYSVTKLTSSLNNSFVKEGSGFGRTYNGKFPNFQIDYISATRNIEILNHRVIEAKLSDHFPVRSDLKLQP